MYIPSAFKEDDPQKLAAFIQSHSFALLVSGEGNHLQASHLPFLFDGSRGKCGFLQGHMARANSQWQSLGSGEVLVVFQGPHAYISPTWYGAPGTVPTWNYAAVHAYGLYRPLADETALRGIIKGLVEKHEASLPNPWKMESLPEESLQKMLRMIVGFEIEITRLEGKWKLSQNHPLERREGVVRALRGQGSFPSAQMADLMEGKNV